MRVNGGWVAVAAFLPSLACVATSVMTAGSPVPVVIGPVACIGCVPAPARQRAAATASFEDAAGHTSGYVTLPRIGDVNFFGDSPPTIDAKTAALAPDPCTVDVHLSKITASSFGVVALVYLNAKQTVKVTGGVSPVPGGSCLAPSGPYAVSPAPGAGASP